MAYVTGTQDEEKDQQGTPEEGAPEVIQGGTSLAGATSTQQKTSNPSQAGGGFASFSDLVTRNQPQAEQLAQTLANKASEGVNTAQQKVGAAKQTFEDLVKAGSLPAGSQDVVNEALANPTTYVSTPGNVEKFQNITGATYTGPQDFASTEAFVPTQTEIESDLERATRLSNPSQYKQSLYELQRNPTPGKVGLDVALLQATPGAAEAFSEVTPKAEAVRQSWQDLIDQGAQEAAAAKTGVQQMSQQAKDSLQSSINEFHGNIDKRLESIRSSSQGDFSTITSKLNNLQNLDDRELGLLGINRDQLNALYSAESALRSDYGVSNTLGNNINYTSTTGSINRWNAATQADYDKEAALAALFGQELPYLPASQRGQAGTAVTDLGNFNQDVIGSLGSTLASKDQATLSQMKTLTDQLVQKNADIKTEQSRGGPGTGGKQQRVAAMQAQAEEIKNQMRAIVGLADKARGRQGYSGTDWHQFI